MRLVVAICFVAIVMGSQISSELNKKLENFADHPYSKTLANLVTLNMQTGGSLNELKQLLASAKDQVIQLQQLQEAEYTQTVRRCQVDNAALSATLEQANNDLKSQRTEQTNLNTESETLNARIREDTASLDRNTKSLNEQSNRVNTENSDFESKNEDYTQALQSCKEAQKLLLNLRTGGASLIQVSQETKENLIQTRENLNRIKTALEAHTKKTSLTLFQPIIEGLLEMSTQVDPDTLNNVLSLVARLITSLQEGQDQLDSTHQTQVTNLNALEVDLKNERQTLQNAITTGNNRLREIQSRLNELDGLVSNSNSIVEVTQLNLDDSETACTRREDEFQDQKVSRAQEIDIASRLIEFVGERQQQ